MSDGKKTNLYDLKGCKDVDELAEMLDLRGDEFNCLKAIFGIAIARKSGKARHSGTSKMRDANKLAHYGNRVQRRIEKEEAVPELKECIVKTDNIKPEVGNFALVGSNAHFCLIINTLYENGVHKTPHGGSYEKFKKGLINYIQQHHDGKIHIAITPFGVDLAVIELR